jgi:hypothetical protein
MQFRELRNAWVHPHCKDQDKGARTKHGPGSEATDTPHLTG